MPAITLSNTGNLLKVAFSGTKVRYFDTLKFISKLTLDSGTLIVSSTYELEGLFTAHLSDITINGVVLSDVASFETAIRSLIFGYAKLDPLIAVGFMPTALTANLRRITALGNNPDVDTGSVPETIWPGGGLYPWMTGATSLEVVSSGASAAQDAPGGTGMAAILLTLMNTSYVESTVSVALNGTTPVAITGTWFRINGGITTVKGSGAPAVGAFNAGDIIIRDAGGGTTRAIIPAGKGILRQAVFTVPAANTLQILSQYIAFNRGTGGVTRFLTVTGYIQNSAGVARRPLDISCDGEPYRHDGIPGITLPEKTDFAMDVLSVSGENSDITGAFLGVLMKNELITNLIYP